MGRPAKHTADDFLDAAVVLFARNGIGAVTLGAVADSIGAANGSIYHRFPDRQSLLTAVWTRTTTRFRDGYEQVLGRPTLDSAVEAAVWVVDWCREHLPDAQVLAAGPRTFSRGEDLAAQRRASDANAKRTVTRAVEALAPHTAAEPRQIAFVLMELPLAVIRRPLQAGKAPGRRDAELVRSLAEVILRRPV